MKDYYMDHAATTPLSKDALEAMMPYLTTEYGNASTVYTYGQRTKAAVERSRRTIAATIGAKPSEIYFTSGGTESDNWALIGAAEAGREQLSKTLSSHSQTKILQPQDSAAAVDQNYRCSSKASMRVGHIITDTIEHHAILHTCAYLEKRGFDVTYLPVDHEGHVDPDAVMAAIRPDTLLVSIMVANNEIGTLEPIAEIGARLQKHAAETGQRILFIAPEGQLKAVITDGDIRKFFLRVGTPDQTIDNAANYHPISLSVSERGKARELLQKHCIDALPILNKRGVITDIVFAHGVDVDNRKHADIPVVMMAGGLGTRLYPYTKILPKPLIPVGEQPIAELIMDRFRDFGCHDFTMIVNYKRGMIKSYFGELEKDYTVNFADEDVFMGTGGGLCLLKGKMKSPFFFTNCDTLLDVDFGDIYEYHKAHGNLVTMVCAFKHYTVPYGVVELGEDGGIAAMREKPELDFLTNTGVYVVEPRVVEEMRDGEKIGFPDVIERYRAAGEKVGVYPISESSWMDMGQLEELEKMRRKLESQQ